MGSGGILVANYTVLFAENEEELQKVMDKFYNVCARRKQKVNAGKSKGIVFERREVEMVDFNAIISKRSEEQSCQLLLSGQISLEMRMVPVRVLS